MNTNEIYILGIESSCDETSAAVIHGTASQQELHETMLLSNIISTQSVHEQYGGVVPELASRAHQQNIVPTVHQAISEAKITKSQLSAVAFTRGPGLLGALLVGTSFAKSMAYALGIPLIGVHHMHAHVLAHFLEAPRPSFPFLCLTVSGGHTQLVHVHDYLQMEVIGTTKDDAVGEAFDKTAKILGLSYPGGPMIEKHAENGNPEAFAFPKTSMDGLAYSFSGIKTAFLYLIQKGVKDNPAFVEENLADLCASVQKTLIEMLMEKLITAAEQYQVREIAIAGGVAANKALRAALEQKAKEKGWQLYIPDFSFCTDNAAMIAMSGCYQFLARDFAGWDVQAEARVSF